MERGIIQHYHRFLREARKELRFKPILKPFMIHRPVISAWSKDIPSHLSGYNPCACILAATDLVMDQFPSGGIAIFSVQVFIYTRFIHICNSFWRYIGYFVLIFCYLVVILLLVVRSLFFRVMCRRTNAFWTADCAHPISLAISFW